MVSCLNSILYYELLIYLRLNLNKLSRGTKALLLKVICQGREKCTVCL